MNFEQWIVISIFVSTIVGLIRFQHIPEQIFAAAALICFAFNFISTEQLLSNSVNPGLLTLVLLIICSFSIEKTSYLRRLTQFLFAKSKAQSYVRTLVTTVLSSAFLNNTAVVATLISPIKNNKLIAPEKLLIPVSYAAILGGTLTLIGTSTNLIVNSMLIEKGEAGFAFLDFFAVGAAAAVICLLVVLFRLRLLQGEIRKDKTRSEYFVEAQVEPKSNLIGKSVQDNGLRNLDSLFLVEIIRQGRLISPVTPTEIIEAGDKLIFSGDVRQVSTLRQFNGLSLFAQEDGLLKNNLTEVVIRPGSAVIGKTLKTAGFRARFDAAVVAIRREGERISGKLGEVQIQAGDYLVLAVGDDFSTRTNLTKNFFILSGKKTTDVLSTKKEKLVLLGFVASIASSVLFDVVLFKCFVFYVAFLLATNCLSINEIKRRFPIEIWVIVVSALTLATSLDNVGLSELLATSIDQQLNGSSVYIALVLIFLSTLVLTEVITNNAAAALIFPIAYSVAEGLGVSVMPFVMAVAFGASGSFISPYGYQTNLMVYNAGNYKLKDFVRFGWLVSLTYSMVVLIAIPLVFPF